MRTRRWGKITWARTSKVKIDGRAKWFVYRGLDEWADKGEIT